jgi:hypothetical protein
MPPSGRANEPMGKTGVVTDESDVRRIEATLQELGWANHASLDREVRIWTRLSEEVNTYTATVDDYTNDLCSRDYLSEVTSRASSDLRAAIEGQVALADMRFRTSTVEDQDGRLGLYFRIRPEDGWWWHRRPSSGPLADYLAQTD